MKVYEVAEDESITLKIFTTKKLAKEWIRQMDKMQQHFFTEGQEDYPKEYYKICKQQMPLLREDRFYIIFAHCEIWESEVEDKITIPKLEKKKE